MTGESSYRGVAVVGIACRFPGASRWQDFWHNLVNGVESIQAFTDHELLRAGVDAETLRDPAYVKAAPVLAGFDQFDAGFFEYSPLEARLMDPQQRLLLEVAWHALEDAGYCPDAVPGQVGAFIGSGGVVTSYLLSHPHLHGLTGSLEHISNDKDFLSTKLSYKLNLTGPSVNIQTACSTSLVATHLACQSILNGECDMALAGASVIRVPHLTGYPYRKGDILSPDGHCRAYDAEAQGTVFGSGVGVVVLKPLADAVAAGDHIYAVIRGSAINNDGNRKMSYTASSVEGQVRAMLEAFGSADVAPSTIDYVEGHGAGTVVGDPLEVDALTRSFTTDPAVRAGGCALGSVKTNVGHLEQAAGIAALIKTALALHHRVIPPSLNFTTPNPRIDFARGPFRVAAALTDWPERDHPRRAAVNGLGLGGTNAFMILEQAPDGLRAGVATDDALRPPLRVLTLSARSDKAVGELADRWRDHLATLDAHGVANACFTANTGRAALPARCVVIGADGRELAEALAAKPNIQRAGRKRKLAFLFPGQGAQYPGMTRALYDHNRVYREAINHMAERLGDAFSLDLRGVLFGSGDDGRLDRTGYTQPALFAVEWALTLMLKDLGVVPDAVLGHSVGSFAAAAAAGIFKPDDALALIAGRAARMQNLPAGGAMAALFAGRERVEALLGAGSERPLGIAAANSPENTVISGAEPAVQAALARAEQAGIGGRRLPVSHAFHSALMDPICADFEQFAARFPAARPTLSFISDRTGAELTSIPDATYWAEHVRQPVAFAAGLRSLAALGCVDLLEVGPGTALRAFARQELGPREEVRLLGVLHPKSGDWRELLSSVGALWAGGRPVDWRRLEPDGDHVRVSAPTTPFESKRYWLKPVVAAAAGQKTATPGDLVGEPVRLPGGEHHFQAPYAVAGLPWLRDHRVYGALTLPVTAALIALAEAGRRVLKTAWCGVRDVTYQEAFLLGEDEGRLVHVRVGAPDQGRSAASLSSAPAQPADAPWSHHVTAILTPAEAASGAGLGGAAEAEALETIRRRCPVACPVDRYYSVVDGLGLNYGPTFRGVRVLHLGDGEALGLIRLPEPASAATYPLHPALLDACLHLFPAVSGLYGTFDAPPRAGGSTFLPIRIEHFEMVSAAQTEVWSHCRRRPGDDPAEGRYTVDIRIIGVDGHPVAMITGLTVKLLPASQFLPRARLPIEDWLYAVEWVRRPALPAVQAAGPGTWLLVADDAAAAVPLERALTAVGAAWRTVQPGDRDQDQTALTAGIQAAAELALPLAGIVLLTALSIPPMAILTPEMVAAAERRLVLVTQGAIRLVAERADERWGKPRVWLVTRGAQAPLASALGGEAVQAIAWGLGRVAALEHPTLWGGCIDLDQDSEPGLLVDELLNHDDEDQVAWRGGRRTAARLVRRPLDGTDLPVHPPIRPDAGYLITGGLGTLGLKLAHWLVQEQGARHLILTSRRPPNAEAANAIAELAALGATVTVRQADIAEAADVASLFADIDAGLPVLDGVFHCAGLLDDGMLLTMDWAQYARVTRPKVIGGHLLHLATQDRPLGHFVLFSSVLSLTGSMGQLNYVAGNAFLDALVAHRRRLGLPAQALNWGPWDEAGLATESGERGRAIWRARGTEYIPADEGMVILRHALAHGFDHVAVTITDWAKFLTQFPGVPPLYRELADSVPRAAADAVDPAAVMGRLRAAAVAERPAILLAAVAALVRHVLGFDEDLDPDQSLRAVGLDSLMSITLINGLEAVFGVRVQARVMLQGPSVRHLAAIVGEGLPDMPIPVAVAMSEAAGAARHGTPPGGRRPGKGRTGAWLVTRHPRRDPELRLFCFPFAGGGSAVFDRWGASLDGAVEVVAVEPPGRLARIDEPAVRSIEAFVSGLMPELRPRLDRPFAMFGHCLGGLTLYETVRTLQAKGLRMPLHLFVSGARPPNRMRKTGPFEIALRRQLERIPAFNPALPAWRQAEAVFVEIVRSFEIGDSLRMLEQIDLRKLVLPTIRAEFQMALNYPYVPERPLPVPVTCFRGKQDVYFSLDDARAWRRFTSLEFRILSRDGGHFAVVEDFQYLSSVIERTLLGPGKSTAAGAVRPVRPGLAP